MGKYFVMSMRFNKSQASDFGLVPKDEDTAVDPKDNSLWKKTNLYDYGWGKENGFYKTPMLSVNELFDLVRYSKNDEDMYGAAAIIVEKFPEELLHQCEICMVNRQRKKEFKKLVEVFGLKSLVNRSPTFQKSYEQIQNDFLRWKQVYEKAIKL